MTQPVGARHALVFGASGLVGRHLVLTLARAGAEVTAAVRTPASGVRIGQWLRDRGLSRSIRTMLVDFDAPELAAGDPAALASVTEVHNCAGTYRFGMTAAEARNANVGIVEKLLDFAKGLPQLQRVVHVSGYRVGGQDPGAIPWSDAHRADVYQRLGAYEASKVESDAIFQARAAEYQLPWTIVNPSSVIGDSITGESDQLIGLANTVEQLHEGNMLALPGGKDTFLPVVTVDYLADFMAAAAIDPNAESAAYWVLDDNTPPLADMLAHIGRHIGAKVPRVRMPVGVISRLPQRLTGADPETLTFMSADRYPTTSAQELAARNGLEAPGILVSLERWADYLSAHRFSSEPTHDSRFVDVGGVRTFEVGVPEARRVIFPGLPVNAETWARVAAGIAGRAVDLPGLGLSGGVGVADWARWLPAIVAGEPVHLVGHSLGAAAAVLAADRFPAQLASVTLVAPFFLQPRPDAAVRLRPLVGAILRRSDAAALSLRLTGSAASAAALESSVRDLKRGAARRVAAQLALAASPRWRAELRGAFARLRIPIRVIVGSEDPIDSHAVALLASMPNVELVTLPGAGHHPQLTDVESLIGLIAQIARQ